MIARPIVEGIARVISGSIGNTGNTGPRPPYTGVLIVQQPSDWSGLEGDTAVFQVVATSGNGPPQYQWQEELAGVWTNMSGKTTNVLSITNVLIPDNGRTFRCVVTNLTNSQPSQPASIIITGAIWFILDELGNRLIDEPATANIVDERSP